MVAFAVDLVALDAALRPIADWLVTFALHSTLALALGWSFAALLGHRARALQETVLRLALVAPLVSATLQLTVFGSPWSPWFAVAAEAPPVDAQPIAALVLDAADVAALPVVTPAIDAPVRALPAAAVVVAAAALCAACGALWLLVLARRLCRLLRDRRPVTEPRVLAAAATMATALGLRQSPHLSRCERLATPIAFGWLRPEVCVPVRADALDDAALGAMLGHELAHLRRGDPAWMWFAAAVQALFPWQLLWTPVRRRWARLVELRCDAVAAAQTSPTSVARCLVEVATWLQARGEPVTALGMAARPSALRERVQAALHGRLVPAPRRATTAAVAAVSLSALTFAAPGAAGREPAAIEFAIGDVEALAIEPSPDRTRLANAIQALQHEHELLAAQADDLLGELAGAPSPQSELLASALRQRLADLARLRARLEARFHRPFPVSR